MSSEQPGLRARSVRLSGLGPGTGRLPEPPEGSRLERRLHLLLQGRGAARLPASQVCSLPEASCRASSRASYSPAVVGSGPELTLGFAHHTVGASRPGADSGTPGRGSLARPGPTGRCTTMRRVAESFSKGRVSLFPSLRRPFLAQGLGPAGRQGCPLSPAPTPEWPRGKPRAAVTGHHTETARGSATCPAPHREDERSWDPRAWAGPSPALTQSGPAVCVLPAPSPGPNSPPPDSLLMPRPRCSPPRGRTMTPPPRLHF